MSIASIEKYCPEGVYYALKDKLWGYVTKRSEEAFLRAEKEREKITSKEELERYTREKRELFIESIGGIPYDKELPLNAKITGVIEEEGLKIEKVIFESRPGVYVTGNLYIPEKRKEPCGAVLFQIGHAAAGKTGAQYQRVARAIASCGLVVFVFEPVGQGERLSYFEPELGINVVGHTIWDHQYAGEQCVLSGDCIARYFIADAMRAVDYLETRPEVDKDKIGATGSSGGGTATCHIMLCDERIKAAAPGTFVTTRRDYMYAGGAQDSEQIYVGLTEKGFDHHEFLMCFAPKPTMLLIVDYDFFPIEGAEEVFDTSRRFYKMYDAEDKLLIEHDKSPHKYTDSLAIKAGEFFARELNGEEVEADRSMLKSIPENKLWCTSCGQIKSAYEDSKFVFDENRERFLEKEKPQISVKEFLTEKMNFARKKEKLHLRKFTTITEPEMKVTPLMWFGEKRLPNYALLFEDYYKKAEEIVVCLWANGTNAIEEHIYKIREILKSGKSVLVLDLSGMGKLMPHALNPNWNDKAIYGVLDKLAKDLFFLGDSLCALRLFELGYCIDEVSFELGVTASIYAEGIFAHYARLYNEVNDDIKIELYTPAPSYSELVINKYYENYNISGVLMPGIANFYKD